MQDGCDEAGQTDGSIYRDIQCNLKSKTWRIMGGSSIENACEYLPLSMIGVLYI